MRSAASRASTTTATRSNARPTPASAARAHRLSKTPSTSRASTHRTLALPEITVDALSVDLDAARAALDAFAGAARSGALEWVDVIDDVKAAFSSVDELLNDLAQQAGVDVAIESFRALQVQLASDPTVKLVLDAARPVISLALPGDETATAATTAVAGTLTALAALNAGREEPKDDLPTTYDIPAIREYWSKRPLAMARRGASLLKDVLGWVVALLGDIQSGKIEKNSEERASQLKDIIAKQGPAFVKVGQAVAIRPDLLPPAYLVALQTLLDQVAPFSSDEARTLISEQLGRPLEDVFEDVSVFDKPVASASIGQVYRARLKKTKALEKEQGDWGLDVAVKVQRPKILDVVTLDLLVIRSVLEALSSLPKDGALGQIQQGAAGFLPVLDVAAERFLEELDYGLEAANASRFEADMNRVSVVRGTIKVPHVFLGLSGRQVLTQEWVDGRKLTEIEASNTNKETREKLVETLLNSYMVQFLDTGFLHADPHPGNFLLCDDGRLCILDYGMMTTISEEQRIAFVEYIAHLSAREYDKTLNDLVNLGFVPRELADDPVSRSVVVPVLAETLETLYGSGGGITTKTDALNAQQTSRVGELGDKLDDLAKKYPLQLPPYFVLILRAFGTLEGLGLSVDSNYAIVDECFPYIARRLLSDDSPRMQAALRSFVYGGSDRLKVSRVRDIAGGFAKFTNSMGATEALTVKDKQALSSIDPATRDALAIVFSGEGNYLQDLVVEEAVRAADALSRNGAAQTWQLLGRASPFAALAGVTPLMLLPGINASIVLSLLASQNKDAITLTFDDKKNLALLRSIIELVGPPGMSESFEKAISEVGRNARQPTLPQFPLNGFSQTEAQALASLVPTVTPGVRRMTTKFSEKLAQRLVERTRDDLSKFPIPGAARNLTLEPNRGR